MNLKYQPLISSFGLKIDCPFKNCVPEKRDAFRWVLNPVNLEINFLPNFLYDKQRGIDITKQKFLEEETCKRCGISLFNTKDNALNTFKSMPPRIKQKLGYTHLAEGTITGTDGLSSEITSNGHYTFFEYDNASFKSTFSIIDVLK